MISRATGAARGRLGASYIEVLVGVFVMVTLAVAVTGLATVGTKTAFNNKLTTQAQAIANEKSELIRILSYDDVGYLSLQGCVEEDLECEPDGVLSKNEEVLRDSVTYNVNILVQLIDDETNGTLDPDEQKTEDNADYKQVYISVSTPSTETAQSNVQVSLISVRGKSCTTSDSCYGDQVCCDNVCQEPCNPAEIPPGWRCTADLCGVLPPGGDPCNEDLDCLEGWRCDPATNECGGDGDEDEDCELDEDCLASLHCGPGGTCIDDGVNGDPCDASSDCVSGFCDAVTQQCDDGGDNGSPCTGGWDCLSGECDLVSAQCIGDGPGGGGGGGGGGEEGVGGSSNCGPPEVNGCYVYVRDDVNGDGLCEVTNIYKSPECSEAWCDTIPDDGQVVSSCGVQDPDYPRAITACDLEMVSNTKCDYDVECIDLYGSNATCQPYDGLPDPSSVACPNGKPDCAGYGADAQCGDPAGLDPGHCYVRGNCYLPGQNNCGACTPQETWTSYDQGVTDPSSFIPFDVSPRISCCYYFDRGTVTSGVPDPPLITEYSTRPCRAPSEPCQVNGQWGTCELSEVNNESTGCSYYKCSVTPPPTATPVGARGVCPGAGNAWSTAASSINIDKDSPSIKITDYYSMEPAVVYSIDTDKYVDELGRNLQVGDMLRFNLDCQVNDDGGVAGTFDLLLPNADSYLFNKIKAWLKAAVPVADAQATGNCGFRIGISNRSDIDNGDFTQLENATSGDPYGKFSYYLQQSDSDKVVVLIVTPASSEQEQVLAGTAEITGNLYININNPNCYLCGCLVDDPLHPLDSIPENLTLTMGGGFDSNSNGTGCTQDQCNTLINGQDVNLALDKDHMNIERCYWDNITWNDLPGPQCVTAKADALGQSYDGYYTNKSTIELYGNMIAYDVEEYGIGYNTEVHFLDSFLDFGVYRDRGDVYVYVPGQGNVLISSISCTTREECPADNPRGGGYYYYCDTVAGSCKKKEPNGAWSLKSSTYYPIGPAEGTPVPPVRCSSVFSGGIVSSENGFNWGAGPGYISACGYQNTNKGSRQSTLSPQE